MDMLKHNLLIQIDYLVFVENFETVTSLGLNINLREKLCYYKYHIPVRSTVITNNRTFALFTRKKTKLPFSREKWINTD